MFKKGNQFSGEKNHTVEYSMCPAQQCNIRTMVVCSCQVSLSVPPSAAEHPPHQPFPSRGHQDRRLRPGPQTGRRRRAPRDSGHPRICGWVIKASVGRKSAGKIWRSFWKTVLTQKYLFEWCTTNCDRTWSGFFFSPRDPELRADHHGDRPVVSPSWSNLRPFWNCVEGSRTAASVWCTCVPAGAWGWSPTCWWPESLPLLATTSRRPFWTCPRSAWTTAGTPSPGCPSSPLTSSASSWWKPQSE